MKMETEKQDLESKLEESKAKQKILVIDDDAGIRELIKFAFKDKYDVIPCSSAEDAEVQLEKNDVSLILSDVGLPGEDGLSFRKRTKDKYDAPIIFFSGLDKEKLEDQSWELGAFNYLRKPLRPKELLSQVENITKKLDADKNFHFMNVVYSSYIAKQNGGIKEDVSQYKITSAHKNFKKEFGMDYSQIKSKNHKEFFESLGISEQDRKIFYDILSSEGKVIKKVVYAKDKFLELNATFP